VKLSVVIVTWNSAEDIESCLSTLNYAGDFEVLVVDNGSQDRTADIVAGWHNVDLLRNDRNLGYARANNQGIAATTGDYVLLLNPDTRLELGTIDKLTDCLDARPDLAAVAPRLVNDDGTTQDSVRSFPTPSNVLWEVTGLARLFPRSRSLNRWFLRGFDYERDSLVDQPMASCLLIRRTVLAQLGGFDERFPIFYNDVDLSRRMRDAGHKTLYLNSVRVFHKRGASTGKARARMIRESHRSLFAYLRKHDRSGLFWLKAIWLLPLVQLTAELRVLAWRLSAKSRPSRQRG
jgi:GT2 family glycosyltransferase